MEQEHESSGYPNYKCTKCGIPQERWGNTPCTRKLEIKTGTAETMEEVTDQEMKWCLRRRTDTHFVEFEADSFFRVLLFMIWFLLHRNGRSS